MNRHTQQAWITHDGTADPPDRIEVAWVLAPYYGASLPYLRETPERQWAGEMLAMLKGLVESVPGSREDHGRALIAADQLIRRIEHRSMVARGKEGIDEHGEDEG